MKKGAFEMNLDVSAVCLNWFRFSIILTAPEGCIHTITDGQPHAQTETLPSPHNAEPTNNYITTSCQMCTTFCLSAIQSNDVK